MKRVEGVKASYVGPDDRRSGVNSGDRCLVLSDEGQIKHVRWLTGVHKDAYGQVYSRHLVFDKPVNERYDEFVFEAGRGPTEMSLDVSALHKAGGHIALLEAMESEGHLENLRHAAVEAVRAVHHAIANDESWDAVRQALGERSDEVVKTAIVAALTVAAESDIEQGFDPEFDGSDIEEMEAVYG